MIRSTDLGRFTGRNYPSAPIPSPLDKLALPALLIVGNVGFWVFAIWGAF